MNKKEKLKQIFTVANIISFSRIIMAIPLVMALDKGWFDDSIRYYVCAAIIFFIFLSDILDGIIARWMDQVSNIGKIIDPVADKICMMVVLIYLIKEYGNPFLLFFLLITFRDTILIIIGIYLLQHQEEIFQSLESGKIFMFLSTIMMISYIFPFPNLIRYVLYISSIIFFIVSSYFYYKNYRKSFLRIKNVQDL